MELVGQLSHVLNLPEVSYELHNHKIACEATNRVGKAFEAHNVHVQCK